MYWNKIIFSLLLFTPILAVLMFFGWLALRLVRASERRAASDVGDEVKLALARLETLGSELRLVQDRQASSEALLASLVKSAQARGSDSA